MSRLNGIDSLVISNLIERVEALESYIVLLSTRMMKEMKQEDLKEFIKELEELK